MKIRTARKILKIWDCQTDKRFYESDDIKDGKKFRHFANLYRKANVRWNKTNDPQANVSIFKAIIRNAKSCEHCAHYEAFQAYGRMVGRCELGDLAGALGVDFDKMNPCKYHRAFDKFTFTENAFALTKGLCRDIIGIEKRIQFGLEYVTKWAKSINIDLDWHIDEKMKYNATRPPKYGKAY